MTPNPPPSPSFARRPWALWAVAAVALYLFPYSAQLNNPNERTRVLQARALLERGQFHIGEVQRDPQGRYILVDLYGRRSTHPFVNDMALVCEDPSLTPPRCTGKLYPAKAPGTALLGVPALALARAVGFVPEGPRGEPRATWVLRYGGVTLWFLLGLWWLGRELERAGTPTALVQRAVMATGLGTSAFPYAVCFVGHTLAGVALLGGLSLVHTASRAHAVRRHALAVLAGLTTGWAVLLEYHAALAVLVVTGFVVLRRTRWALVPGFALGGLMTLALHAALHIHMFGSALQTGHFHLLSAHNRQSQASGFLGLDGLHGESLVDHLFDPYMGLLPIMPWLGLGLVLGTRALVPRGQGETSRGVGRAALAIVVAYLLFVSSLGNARTMNGWSIGPRYLTPALLPMALVAGHGWWWASRHTPWLARVCAGLAGASSLIVVAISSAYPSPPPDAANVFGELAVPLLRTGHATRNLLMAVGPWSLLPLGVALLAAAAFIAAGRDAWRAPEARWWPRVGLGLTVMLAWTAGLALYAPSDTQVARRTRASCIHSLEGVSPGRERGFFDP